MLAALNTVWDHWTWAEQKDQKNSVKAKGLWLYGQILAASATYGDIYHRLTEQSVWSCRFKTDFYDQAQRFKNLNIRYLLLKQGAVL